MSLGTITNETFFQVNVWCHHDGWTVSNCDG
jgi:hypothetical protein